MTDGSLLTTSIFVPHLQSMATTTYTEETTVSTVTSAVTPAIIRCVACSGTTLKSVFALLFALIITFGVCGNTFVVSVIISDRKLLQSSINLLLLNLALADLGNLIFCTPDIVQVLMDQGWVLPGLLCPVIRFLQEYFLYTSVLMQMTIGIERFLAICVGFRFSIQRFSRKTTVYVILFVWSTAFLFALPYLLYQRILRRESMRFCFWTTISGRTRLMFKYAECAVLYFVPLILLTVLYTIMSRVLWGAKHANIAIANEAQALMLLKIRRSVVKMLIISMLLYALLYSPIQGIFIVETTLKHRVHISQGLRLTLNALSFSSSAVNPVLFTIFCHQFRKRFIALVRPLLDMFYSKENAHYSAINAEENPVTKAMSRSQFVSFRKDLGVKPKLSFANVKK